LQFEGGEGALGCGEVALNLDRQFRIRLDCQQLKQTVGVVETTLEVVERSDPPLEGLDFLNLGPGPVGVSPERGFALPGFEVEQSSYLAIQVKETPAARPSAASVPPLAR
jgi:hypothetical protein